MRSALPALSSTLSKSGGVGEGIGEAFEEGAGDFYHVGSGGRRGKRRDGPEAAADGAGGQRARGLAGAPARPPAGLHLLGAVRGEPGAAGGQSGAGGGDG